MKICDYKNQLFMIMDTVADFDHEQAMKELATKPRQSEWEAYVARFQVTTKDATANEKWQLMERIYEMDQKEVFDANDGHNRRSAGNYTTWTNT